MREQGKKCRSQRVQLCRRDGLQKKDSVVNPRTEEYHDRNEDLARGAMTASRLMSKKKRDDAQTRLAETAYGAGQAHDCGSLALWAQ